MQAMRGKQEPVRQVWSKIIYGTDRDKLGYLMRIRQNRLVLNERLADKGVREGGECRVCAKMHSERTETGDNKENLEHVWARCVLGREGKEKLEKEVAEMIRDSTVGPEWKYMHRAAQAQKWKLTVKKEHRKDPEEADVHYTFMSNDGREIDFEGEEGIKKWNRIGGDKKISRQILCKRLY